VVLILIRGLKSKFQSDFREVKNKQKKMACSSKNYLRNEEFQVYNYKVKKTTSPHTDVMT